MQTNDIIDKIKKLLALGNKAGTEHEANAAMSKAHELLAKHNLDMSVIDSHNKPEQYTTEKFSAVKNNPWQSQVWGAISRMYFCNYYYSMNGQHCVIGKPSNIAIVQHIANYIVNTGESLAQESANLHYPPNKRSFTNSFKKGYANRISARVTEEINKAMNNTIKDSTTGNALILHPLYNQTKKEIELYKQTIGLRLQNRVTTNKVGSISAYHHGQNAGNNVNLHANGITGKHKQIGN